MASEPNFYAYAMESPHVTVKQQLDSCSMWVFNRTSKRHPPQIWDRRTEYGKNLFLRNQGQLLLAAFSFGDVIVMREPQLVFRSHKDFLHTAVIAKQRGIKLAFVRNRFDLKSEAGLRELEAEILRLDSIAVKNIRDKVRNGKKLPLGYRWSDTTDAIVPDGAPKHQRISPIVEQLAAGGLYEQDPVQEPDQRDGMT